MTVLSLLAWILFGILGGFFCAVMVDGPMLLADLRPKSRKAALGLAAVVGLGAVGGLLAGLLVLAITTQTQGGQSVSGAVVGGCCGCFLLPFITNGLYPLVIARLTPSTKDSGFARPLGCVIGIVAFFAGAYLGAQLGSVVGSSSFLLSGALGPFVGGALALVIPLQLWVTLHSETYSWSAASGRASRGTRVSGRAWMRMSEVQRGARARSRRWD